MNRKAFYVSCLVVVVMSLAVGYGIVQARKGGRSQNPHQHRQPSEEILRSAKEKYKEDQRIIDGSKEPEKIPDHLAFELFMRSLIPKNDTDENEKRRVRLFAMDAGFNEGEAEVVVFLAAEFGKQIRELDMEATRIYAGVRSVNNERRMAQHSGCI